MLIGYLAAAQSASGVLVQAVGEIESRGAHIRVLACVACYHENAHMLICSWISWSQIETILENHHLKFSEKSPSPQQSPEPAKVRRHHARATHISSGNMHTLGTMHLRRICLYLVSRPLSEHQHRRHRLHHFFIFMSPNQVEGAPENETKVVAVFASHLCYWFSRTCGSVYCWLKQAQRGFDSVIAARITIGNTWKRIGIPIYFEVLSYISFFCVQTYWLLRSESFNALTLWLRKIGSSFRHCTRYLTLRWHSCAWLTTIYFWSSTAHHLKSINVSCNTSIHLYSILRHNSIFITQLLGIDSSTFYRGAWSSICSNSQECLFCVSLGAYSLVYCFSQALASCSCADMAPILLIRQPKGPSKSSAATGETVVRVPVLKVTPPVLLPRAHIGCYAFTAIVMVQASWFSLCCTLGTQKHTCAIRSNILY